MAYQDDDILPSFGRGEDTHKLLGQILKEMGVLTESRIQEALAIQRHRGGLIGEILTDLNYVAMHDVRVALGFQTGMEVVELEGRAIPHKMIERMPVTAARAHKVIPISLEDSVLTVAMADPSNYKTLNDLRFLLDIEVRGAISDPPAILRALERYYPE